MERNKSIKYFYVEPKENQFLVKCDAFALSDYLYKINGSYNVLAARLFGLTYAQYCRFCRDKSGATIVGKNHKYPIPYFNSEEKAVEIANILNKRFNFIMEG